MPLLSTTKCSKVQSTSYSLIKGDRRWDMCTLSPGAKWNRKAVFPFGVLLLGLGFKSYCNFHNRYGTMKSNIVTLGYLIQNIFPTVCLMVRYVSTQFKFQSFDCTFGLHTCLFVLWSEIINAPLFKNISDVRITIFLSFVRKQCHGISSHGEYRTEGIYHLASFGRL